MGRDVIVFLTAFAGSSVEFVEALTIVLAVGLTRGWRSSLLGAAGALIILAGAVALLGGTVLAHVPRALFELVIGLLILALGVSWLRKAVLRAAGLKALHDEARKFAAERARLATAPRRGTRPPRDCDLLPGRAPRGLRDRFHRVRGRCRRAITRTGRCGRGCRRAARGRSGRRAAPATRPGSREHAEVRGRHRAYEPGHLLGREGAGVTWPVDVVSLAPIAASTRWAALTAVAALRRRPPLRPGEADSARRRSCRPRPRRPRCRLLPTACRPSWARARRRGTGPSQP